MGELTKKITGNPGMSEVIAPKEYHGADKKAKEVKPIKRPEGAMRVPPLNRPILPLSRNVLGKKNDFSKIKMR